MEHSLLFSAPILVLKAKDLGRTYSALKDFSLLRERELGISLAQVGQLEPVCVALDEKQQYQLMDGFKRVHVLEKRDGGEALVQARCLQGNPITRISAILLLNWGKKSVTVLEEGLTLLALAERGLSQKEIAALLKREKTWVSRRLSLVNRLTEEVLESLKRGLIHAGAARMLALLPRGNQSQVLEVILEQKLSMRDQEALRQELLKEPQAQLTKAHVNKLLQTLRNREPKQRRDPVSVDALASALSAMRDGCRLAMQAAVQRAGNQPVPRAFNDLFNETMEAAESSIRALQ